VNNCSKNILFLDFNRVISFDPFWKSLEVNNTELFNRIEDFLFKKNRQIIRDWMTGVYSSEDVHHIFSKENCALTTTKYLIFSKKTVKI